MKKTALLLICVTFYFCGFSQDIESSKSSSIIEECGEFKALEKMKREDPIRYQKYLQSRVELEEETEAYVPRSGTIYTIPVVFHVLHNYGSENVSDLQIQSALDILNRDFRRLNLDANSVYPPFLSLVSDVEIEFVFAKIAPNGECFDGITRTVSTETNNGDDGMSQVNTIIDGNDVFQGIWPHNKYLNIYVCKNIGGYAGYTYKPNGSSTATAGNMKYNGIFLKHNYCGSIGSSSVYRSRTLTHEVGHWLNLSHVWGDGNSAGLDCGDDNVPDTPITKGFSFCPTSPVDAKVCDPNIVENYENYMDYTRCRKMFTLGQAARMRAAIINTTGGRNNIWTAANFLEVVDDGSPTSLCDARIDADTPVLCEGASATFSVTGATEPITSYSWTFPGGSPTTSTQENPTVTYSTPGTYDVTLIVSTSSGSKTLSNAEFISVQANRTVYPLPISEGFVSTYFPPSAGWTINNGGSASTWERSTHGTFPTVSSSANLKFDADGNNNGDIDDLNTPSFSLAGYGSATLTFDVAYRQFSDNYTDKLEVLISTACGMPYEVVYSKENPDLQTEPDGFGYEDPTTWRNETIDLTSYIGATEARVKFRGISGWGNQIYIDNINISGELMSSIVASADTVCQNESVTYTSSATGAPSWSWDFGVGASPATATGIGPHTVSYSNFGSKVVSLSIDGGATSTNKTVLVNAAPTISMSALPTLCVDYSPISLTQGSPSGGTYSGNGVNGLQFDPTIAGIGMHTITYTYTSSTTGCSNSVYQKITVDACLGVNDEVAQLFKIYPNPTTGKLNISSSNVINTVVVYDNVGRLVFTSSHIDKKLVNMDLSYLSKGVYIIETKIGTATKRNRVVID